MQPTYTQPVKAHVRTRILEHAVSTLTKRRARAPVVRADEFQHTLNYARHYLDKFSITDGWSDEIQIEAESWLDFHRAQIGRRKPQELRVLYLCGPEPVNDLEVLLSLGVIPQNIWAVESERDLYRNAVDQLKHHSSYIRIHHGNLDRFFEQVNERFDIIYIDACGPLPSGKPNTLHLPLKLAHHERLAPLGMLITNFAEPAEDRRDIYADLLANYFSPRYSDFPECLFKDDVDPAIAHHEIGYLRPYVHKHIPEIYSDFVTRFLVDLARSIVPQRRILANPELRRKYFAPEDQLSGALRKATAVPHLNEEDKKLSNGELIKRIYSQMGDVHLSPEGYPVATFLRRTARHEQLHSLLNPLFIEKVDGEKIKMADALLTAGLMEHIIEGHWEAASQEMLSAIKGSWFDAEGGIFCDVPMPNLLINSLFGIYGHPYLVNPRASLRVSYTAKSTRMYTDCLLFDQCRYYFDFWPTIDLVPERFRSPAFQLILRTCLDRMGRHDWASSSHPFRGAALGGFGEFKSAEAYEFAARQEVTAP